jgi:hypothetical protein
MGLSLTRRQAASTQAAELVGLLREGTTSGWNSNDQIRSLRDWLQTNSYCAIPAVVYLAAVIDEILVNGGITDAGRHELRVAIERVLPSDIREVVKIKRRRLESEERERAKERTRADTQRAREYVRLNRPQSFNFMIAGSAFEERPEAIGQHLHENDKVFLCRESDNPKDANAIRILAGVTARPNAGDDETILRLDAFDIDYVPRGIAAQMAPLLDSGYKQIATCTKILTQSVLGPIPVIEVSLYHPQANAPSDALRMSVGALNQSVTPSASESGKFAQKAPIFPVWLLVVLVVIFAGIVAAILRSQ